MSKKKQKRLEDHRRPYSKHFLCFHSILNIHLSFLQCLWEFSHSSLNLAWLKDWLSRVSSVTPSTEIKFQFHFYPHSEYECFWIRKVAWSVVYNLHDLLQNRRRKIESISFDLNNTKIRERMRKIRITKERRNEVKIKNTNWTIPIPFLEN